jgi:hypothetical protein
METMLTNLFENRKNNSGKFLLDNELYLEGTELAYHTIVPINDKKAYILNNGECSVDFMISISLEPKDWRDFKRGKIK